MIAFVGCTNATENPINETTLTPNQSVRIYIFGNSLIDHIVTPEPTEEKRVPHWLGLLAQAAQTEFLVDGTYGFIRDFLDFNNIQPQWTYTTASQVWEEPGDPFSAQDYSALLFSPTNFLQYQGPDQAYFDDPNETPLSASLSLYDQSIAAHPNVPFYIYEGWGEMDGGYGTFPGTINLSTYHQNMISGTYPDWYTDLHDQMLAARPGANIRLIPVSRILSTILNQSTYSSLSVLDLYEDDAPHGQSTLYFLASLITYSAIYQQMPPENFDIPNTVESVIRDNYPALRTLIWQELQAFQFNDGRSRVFN